MAKFEEFLLIMKDPGTLILMLMSWTLLLLFIACPLFLVMKLSVTGDAGFTIEHFLRFLNTSGYRQAFMNSLFMAFTSTSVAVALGFIYAYTIVRTDVPGKRVFQSAAILPLISPPFVVGLSFLLLFGRRGLITYGLLGKPFEIYGWHGLLLVEVISFFPLAYIIISGVIQRLNPNLEYAAHNLGADGKHVFKTVTLPLLAPGILSAALIVAINVLADFGNPLLIGGPFRVLATEAYSEAVHIGDLEMSAVLCLILIIPTLTFFILQNYWISKKSFITVTGMPTQLETRPVSKSVKALLFTICSLASAVIFMIYGSIILGALTKVWGVDFSLTLENLELVTIGKYSFQLRNSLIAATSAGFICAVLGIIVAWLVRRKSFLGRSFLEFISLLPLAIPGTVMGIAYILAFNVPPIQLHGTALLVVLSMIFRALPVTVRAGVAALEQISKSIEEASVNLGANTIMTLRNVVLPLLKTAFTAGLVYTFIRSMNTVSTVIFLTFPGFQLASISLLGMAEHGYWSHAAALASIMIMITVMSLFIFRAIVGKKMQLFQV